MIDKGGTPEGEPGKIYNATTHYSDGRWLILVHLPRPAGVTTPSWPRHQWAKRAAAPSQAARVEALALLGYEPAAEWSYVECDQSEDKRLADWGLVTKVRALVDAAESTVEGVSA